MPKYILLLIFILQTSICFGQVNTKSTSENVALQRQPLIFNQNTTFPQIHTNLNGMVREFVRAMYQDKKGNYWFGTNGNGIIRYNGQTLETVPIEGIHQHERVTSIIEDHDGNIWFGTSAGLIKYDGEKFRTFSFKEGLPGEDPEIWGLTIDKNGLFWVGSIGGVSHFDGEKFKPFSLPNSLVENRQHMMSDKLVFKILEDKAGTIWLATDGNGIFKYKNGVFTHLTTKNGLTDNNTHALLEDKQGNIWISSFYGGASKFDGTIFTNFTQDGIIEGIETGSFYEDSKGNIWFTAENIGVYKYDGTKFTLYTTKDGLTTNNVLSIFEDNKGQLWFGTWQGLCIFDGEKFVNALAKEPWTN
jgi:ligand-binding sensor domain-containing protein